MWLGFNNRETPIRNNTWGGAEFNHPWVVAIRVLFGKTREVRRFGSKQISIKKSV